jgi:hypothetical protein
MKFKLLSYFPLLFFVLIDSSTNQNVSRFKRFDGLSSSEDYIFTLPDITTDFKDEYGKKIRLTAFKTKSNDVILKNKSKEEYGQLQWVSLGNPSLVPFKGTNLYFEWKNQYLCAQVSMLKDEHIALLKNKILSKIYFNFMLFKKFQAYLLK